MTQVLTVAEGRALLAQQKGGKKAASVPQVQRKLSAPPKEPTHPLACLQSQEITFPGKVPGLNGAGGLLRMHWAKKAALLAGYIWQIKGAVPSIRKQVGPVKLELIRYSAGRPADFDNLVSTGKLPIDALVRCGILPDDNPQVIPERFYTQVRCKPDEQRTVIRLTPLYP